MTAEHSGLPLVGPGSRSDGELLPYKKGAVVLAIRSQATIIPMAIRGAREVIPPGEWRLRPGQIEVHLLKSIPTRGLAFDDRDDVLERRRALAGHEFGFLPGHHDAATDRPAKPPGA